MYFCILGREWVFVCYCYRNVIIMVDIVISFIEYYLFIDRYCDFGKKKMFGMNG